MPGAGTSKVELTNVSSHCLWVMIDDEELALPFDQFPWFRDATIAQLSVIERPTPDHIISFRKATKREAALLFQQLPH